LKNKELYEILEEYYHIFNNREFIEDDPITVPHFFEKPEDIEISGFLTAVLSWGQRSVIIRNSFSLVRSMPGGPLNFILDAEKEDFERFRDFKHRTFNGKDCAFFLASLQNIYRNHNGLKQVFYTGFNITNSIPGALMYFRSVFFETAHELRSMKHIPNVDKGAAAKRMNMFLRWMVRKDDRGVDFGIWEEIPASALYVPLDVHSGRVARDLGLLKRKQNDWSAVEELTTNLRLFDADDPVKYDYALFGLGAIGKQI